MQNYNYPIQKQLRENDRYIMEVTMQLNLTVTHLQNVNYCRLYFNVISLAGITELDGFNICSEV
jgi:hypothetical protein